MDGWNVVSEKPAGDWDVASEKPVKEKDISLMSGIEDFAKTGLKSAAAFPVFSYEQARHPIDTEKTIIEGIGDIPKTIGEKSQETMSSIGEDLQQAYKNPDYWQKFLRGGRAALSFASSPVSVFGGGVLEPTYGKVVSNATGGDISPSEASFLPEAGIGKMGLKGTPAEKFSNDLKRNLHDVGSEIKQGFPQETTEAKAAKIVRERLQQGEKAGGLSPKEALEQIKKSKALGKPMTLADVGGENVKALAGYTSRQPGASRDIAKQFLTKRDVSAPERLTGDVDKYLANGSVRQTAEALANSRSEAAKPLFEEAFRGGSIAPLLHQFAYQFRDTNDLVQKTSGELNDLLSESAKLRERLSQTKESHIKSVFENQIIPLEHEINKKNAILKQATEDRDLTIQHLRAVHNDIKNNVPGAVWSPKIQRLLDNANLKKGLSRGYRIEKNLADAEGRRLDPTEYAIIGEKDGEPVVGKVPNMRLLATAKEGLDSILSDDAMHDPLTGRLNKEGVSVQRLRDALLGELDRINPKYKEARDVWAGHSRAMESLKYGRNVFNEKPEDIAADINKMSPSEREFARLGAADKIREKILRTGMNGDEAKSIIRSDWAKQQLRPLFKSDKEFNNFIDAVTSERTMFETKYDVLGNSATAKRMAEDQSTNMELAGKAGKGVFDLLSGRSLKALSTLISIKRDIGFRQNPKLNEAIAKLLFEPDVTMESLGFQAEKK